MKGRVRVAGLHMLAVARMLLAVAPLLAYGIALLALARDPRARGAVFLGAYASSGPRTWRRTATLVGGLLLASSLAGVALGALSSPLWGAVAAYTLAGASILLGHLLSERWLEREQLSTSPRREGLLEPLPPPSSLVRAVALVGSAIAALEFTLLVERLGAIALAMLPTLLVGVGLGVVLLLRPWSLVRPWAPPRVSYALASLTVVGVALAIGLALALIL